MDAEYFMALKLFDLSYQIILNLNMGQGSLIPFWDQMLQSHAAKF